MKAWIIVIFAAFILSSGCTLGLPGQGQATPAQNASGQPATPTHQGSEGGQAESGQSQGEEGCSFRGTWDTTWGEMVLRQNGSEVSGTYKLNQGRLNGTVTGSTLKGWWGENANENAYEPPDNAGPVAFNLTEDCDAISGAWGDGSDGEWSGSWSGTRRK